MTMLEQFKPGVEMHFWPGRGASAEPSSSQLRSPVSVVRPISSLACPPASRPKSGGGLHHRLGQRGEQTGKGNGPASFRPRLAVHLDQKLTVTGEGNPGKLDFEISILFKILDRNSQVRFHKRMGPRRLRKSRVHGLVHSQSYLK